LGAFKREWDPIDWQNYALRLVQARHGAQNIQRVPDRVQGDAGIEFFALDGCAYQCYAPEECSDTRKAASAMKGKAARDIQKLHKNHAVLAKIFHSLTIARWILLCPFLDDKEVVASVRAKGELVKAYGLPFLDPAFEALVHSQVDFQNEIDQLRYRPIVISVGVMNNGAMHTQCGTSSGALDDILTSKLGRAFPSLSAEKLETRKQSFIAAYAIRQNILNRLQIDHPILWETAIECVTAEEQRLELTGAEGTAPSEILRTSLNRIEQTLRHDLPDISHSSITQISHGTLSDWLMHCPLDFPERHS
jgi:hypothetical protein